MINLQTPSNTLFFLRLLKSVVNVEIVGTEETLEKHFSFAKDRELVRRIVIEEGNAGFLLSS